MAGLHLDKFCTFLSYFCQKSDQNWPSQMQPIHVSGRPANKSGIRVRVGI